MLSKVLSVVKSKAALVVLGTALVGGGTAAVAAAMSHQNSLTGAHAGATVKTDATREADGNHAHTVSIEGVLKGYNAGAGTISVQVKHGKSTTTVLVNAKTRINGEHVSSLADLAKNIGHKVEVQADNQGNGTLVAWEVTVEDAAGGSSNKGHGDSDNDE